MPLESMRRDIAISAQQRVLMLLVACLGLFLGTTGHAAADTVPADMESHVPLVWNPFGVDIHNVYWDTNWDANNPGFSRAGIDAATAALTQSDYFEGTAQYGVPGRSFTGHSDALGICGSDPGTSLSAVAIYAWMTCETSTPLIGLPGGIYNVFVPSRTTIDNGMCTSYRAYHTVTVQLGVPPTPVYFAVIPLACYSSVASLMSGVSHEDAEILTDPAVGLGWYDTDSAGAAFPNSLLDLLNKAINDPGALIQLFSSMHSEAGDLCESSSPFPPVPDDFAHVPSTPFGIDMELASYWSNAAHACVIGGSRVVEASFQAFGLPAGAGSVLVDNYTRPMGYTHSIRENAPFTFDASVTVGGDRYVADSGTCSGSVEFPAGSTAPSTQRKTYDCFYRKQGFGTGAIAYSDGCAGNALPRNDDGSYGPYPLSFPIGFFGTTYASVFVNNNGNVTFDGPMSTYTPFPLTTTNRVVIAPFFGDVDTRSPSSSVVTWGTTTFAGRPAFCVLWADVGVGYYSVQTDKLNSFQLLLVDRSDIGPGDFDIVMNYDQVQWETGQASGGVDGLGGASARVGYSNGDPASSLELSGSAVNGALPDSSPGGLVHGSRGSTQLGRYIFPVRNGRPPAGGGIGGQVTGPNGAPVVGGLVQVCPSGGGSCVWNGFTGSLGLFDATGIADGVYSVTAFPPAGSTLVPRSVVVAVTGGEHVGADIRLEGPKPPPPGTTISPSAPGGDGVPIVYWHDPLTLRTQGCAGGTATYAITNIPDIYALGSLTEGPAGVYTATVPPLAPAHGVATVGITIHCPAGTDEHVLFDLYIDPSGVVETTTGQPLPDATVTLYRADASTGPYTAVPAGSAIMAPSNRNNPDTTDAAGRFGWNVITGYYRVRASHSGCHAPGDPSQPFAESDVLQIPPAVFDLQLRLACPDTVPPITTASASAAPNAAGWNNTDVTLSLHAVDDPGGSGVTAILWSATGAGASSEQTVPGDTATVDVTAEGLTTITYRARDVAGNLESPRTLAVRLDKTAPTLTCGVDPGVLWPANHKLMDVRASVAVADALSGPAGFTLVSVASSEADEGLGDGDTAGDIQGWSPGTAGTTGKLRAERSGTGGGRTYTLVYRGLDLAGNAATCTVAAHVPHDHG